MAMRLVSNPFPYPQIKEEENLKEPLALPGYPYDWIQRVKLKDRLYNHHTLASIRQDRRLKHPHAPKDSLDLALSAIYNHSQCKGDKNIVCLQAETISPFMGHRLLRNKRKINVIPRAQVDDDKKTDDDRRLPGTKWLGIRHAGLTQRISPFSVKLGLTSNHGPQSNAGFSRKADGSSYSS